MVKTQISIKNKYIITVSIMKKIVAALLVLSITISLASAQSSFRFVVLNGRMKVSNENLISFEGIGTAILFNLISSAYSNLLSASIATNEISGGYRWWTLLYPSYQYGLNSSFFWNVNPKLIRMDYNGDQVDLNYVKPFRFMNYHDPGWLSPQIQSIGYELSLDVKRILPISLFASIDLERRGFNIMDFDIPLTGIHRVSSVIPSVGIRWKFLGNRFGERHNWNIVIEGMLSNVHNTKYKNAYGLYDVSATNDGIRYTLGLGYATFYSKTLSSSWFLRYTWDTFTFFNEDYIAPDGSRPFDGLSNNWGRITFGYQFGI